MKLLLVTRSDDNYKEISDLTHPILKKYAEKCYADFLILKKNYDCPGRAKIFYRILYIYDLFEEYDRILHIDSDVIINKDCPNLFEVVPVNKIGTIYEDKGTRAKDRHNRIKNAQKSFTSIGWKTGYINMGVLLASREHKEIFKKIDGKLWLDLGYADILLGYNIKKYNFEVFELSYKFNHMTMFSEAWNGFANRFDSHIIHYAGKGLFDRKLFRNRFKFENRLEQMKNDFKKIYG